MILTAIRATLVVLLPLLLGIITVLVVVARIGTRRFPRGTVGFLHPSAALGGGGERVVWAMICAIQRDDIAKGIQRRYVLYCTRIECEGGDDQYRKQFLEQLVQRQFHICLQRPIDVVFLRPAITQWLNGERYAVLTLLLQVVCGGLLLFYESCIANSMAPIVIESVGIPGIYPLLSLFAGARIITYTHYPQITSIMTQRVGKGDKRYNNRSAFMLHPMFRKLKIVYYKLFACFYRWLGQFPVFVMTNSRWTMRHMEEMWRPKVPTLVYPPCSVSHFSSLRKLPEERHNTVVSIGQFRPEKNHQLQLRAFARALPRLPRDARLVMVGGARSDEDRKRASEIVDEAEARGISDRVEVRIDAPFSEVGELLSSCCIGLHTMEEEHFGIVLVEYIAAGCIPLGHKSGGVCLDIITSPDVGFLAVSEEEYADCMVEIINMKLQRPLAYKNIQECGFRAISRFSEESFQETLLKVLLPYLTP